MKRSNKDGILDYKAIIKSVKSGTGAVVYLPRQLLGKEIEVNYNKLNTKSKWKKKLKKK